MTKPLLLLSLSSAVAAPSLTIYNQDFAVVRQEVPMNLKPGINQVSFDQVTAQLEPDSVVLRDPSGKLDFQILEQGYRNDPVSIGLMLDHFEGKQISFLVDEEDGKRIEKIGTIIRSGNHHQQHSYRYSDSSTNYGNAIIEVDGKLQFGLPGEPLFPALGEDSILRPTLNWTLDAKWSSGTAELSYLSSGFSWKADYNLVVTADTSDDASLNGWVTLSNNSGTRFDEASISLLAGDVNKIKPNARTYYESSSIDPFAPATRREKTVTQKELGSYHLYNIARPVSLRDNETKQVQFTESNKVKATKSYLYAPLRGKGSGASPNTTNAKKDGFSKDVQIYWALDNTEDNGLGIPLPAGKIRLYQSEDNKLEFLGENTIDHTPQKETIEFYTGNAFDLVGERRIVNFEHNRTDEYMLETIEVKLRNRSKETVTIDTHEPMWRWSKWTIVKSSEDYQKLDHTTLQFRSKLDPDEEEVITFTVRYDY